MTPAPRLDTVGLAHATVLAALQARCFDDAWSQGAIEEILTTPGSFACLASMPQGAADSPVGFALGRIAADEAELLSLGVDPAWRRRGIAQALVETVLQRAAAAGAHMIFLEVAEANDPARLLYATHGFIAVGRRPDYYRRPNAVPVAALILRRSLGLAGRAGESQDHRQQR